MILYITKKKAIEAGLTHEGYLFGVPAWFAGDAQGEVCMATPKFWPLHAWCKLVDFAFEVASWFMSDDTVLVSPIRVTGRIQ